MGIWWRDDIRRLKSDDLFIILAIYQRYNVFSALRRHDSIVRRRIRRMRVDYPGIFKRKRKGEPPQLTDRGIDLAKRIEALYEAEVFKI